MNKITVILPTFNRASFLNQAYESLSSQTFKDWTLIVVDDGSSDNTKEEILRLNTKYKFQCKYIYQENSGPGEARNTGIRASRSEYIAFFDSDDIWEDSYLATAVSLLDKNPDIDWIYFACKRVNFFNGDELLSSTFYTNHEPNPLFSITKEKREDLFILDNDKAAITQIRDGIDSGFQNSVIKKTITDKITIPDFRVGEDRLFILQAIKCNFTLAFVDKVMVTYLVHNENSSDTNSKSKDVPKRISAILGLISSYEHTSKLISLNSQECRVLKERLAEDYFWKLGYSLCLQNGMHADALQYMKVGLKHCPWRPNFYKTFLVTLVKYYLTKIRFLLG